MQFDAEAHHRFAGLRNPIDDTLGPALLDTDYHHRRDVRIAACADQRAEMQFEVGAELQPPIRMRQRHGPLDVVFDRLRRGIGQIVDRQDDHVVAYAHAAIVATIAAKSRIQVNHAHGVSLVRVDASEGRLDAAKRDAAQRDASKQAAIARVAYQRFVLMLCTCACSPALIGATTLPISTPYLNTVSPTAMSFSATL
ncbi:hypothetical protein QFZ99_006537 [Paraburkholderia atlantica]